MSQGVHTRLWHSSQRELRCLAPERRIGLKWAAANGMVTVLPDHPGHLCTVGLHVQDLFMKIILGLQYGRLQRRNARQESISIPVCAVFSPPWLASPRRAALDKMGLSNHRNPHFLGQNQPKCSVPNILILRQAYKKIYSIMCC